MSVTRDRLIGFWHAFDHPVVVGVTVGVGVLLLVCYAGARTLRARKWIEAETYQVFFLRWRSWCWLAPCMLVPVLLGAAWVMLAVMMLSLLCFGEYARVTGLFREKTISGVVVLGIVLVALAVADHFDRLFYATAPLICALIAVVTLPQDRPQGYIQRVALGVLGFVLLGYSFGYLGQFANAADYRPVLTLILLAVEMNDLFGYTVGSLVRGPKLLPQTSPGRTISGSLGALVLTTLLVTGLGQLVFANTVMGRLDRLLVLGAMISVLGQLGKLMMSAIKRDVQIKETGTALPGHGGLLDRFDSLVLVPPAVYHYLSLQLGPLGGPPQRLLTGW